MRPGPYAGHWVCSLILTFAQKTFIDGGAGAALCLLDTRHPEKNAPGPCPHGAYGLWNIPRGKQANTMQSVVC